MVNDLLNHFGTYRIFDVSKAPMVSGPGTQSSSLKGPGLVNTLWRCFLRGVSEIINDKSEKKGHLTT